MSSSLFSRSSSQAVRALTCLAMQPLGKLCSARELSEHEHIPRALVPKILLPLRRARLVRSFRGIGGGYDLALPPDQINLLEIVRCMDGAPLEDCMLEDHPCSDPHECAFHPFCSALRQQLLGYLERTTLGDLVRFRQSVSHEKDLVPCLSSLPDRSLERRGE